MSAINLTPLFGDDTTVLIDGDPDGPATLHWNDGVANKWTEVYPSLSLALARAAVLAYCASTGWDRGFAEAEVAAFTHPARIFLAERTAR